MTKSAFILILSGLTALLSCSRDVHPSSKSTTSRNSSNNPADTEPAPEEPIVNAPSQNAGTASSEDARVESRMADLLLVTMGVEVEVQFTESVAPNAEFTLTSERREFEVLAPDAPMGMLDAADIQRVVAKGLGLIKKECWNAALAARTAHAADYCILKQVRTWKFPPAGDETTVNVPFVFSAK